MPLSEHERQLLDEIEQTLRAEDPALATSLRAARPLPAARIQLVIAALGAAIGLGVVFIGVRLNSWLGTVVAIAGFLVIVGGGEIAARAVLALRHRRARTPRRYRTSPPTR